MRADVQNARSRVVCGCEMIESMGRSGGGIVTVGSHKWNLCDRGAGFLKRGAKGVQPLRTQTPRGAACILAPGRRGERVRTLREINSRDKPIYYNSCEPHSTSNKTEYKTSYEYLSQFDIPKLGHTVCDLTECFIFGINEPHSISCSCFLNRY
jgi:hypothetical protein